MDVALTNSWLGRWHGWPLALCVCLPDYDSPIGYILLRVTFYFEFRKMKTLPLPSCCHFNGRELGVFWKTCPKLLLLFFLAGALGFDLEASVIEPDLNGCLGQKGGGMQVWQINRRPGILTFTEGQLCDVPSMDNLLCLKLSWSMLKAIKFLSNGLRNFWVTAWRNSMKIYWKPYSLMLLFQVFCFVL